MAKTKEERRQFIKKSIRKKISGTAQRPRMSVFRSNKQIYVQLIDDEVGKTLAAASSRENGIENEKITKTEQAAKVGALIAEKAKAVGIETVVFDRNGYLYHGRVKSLADAARNGGFSEIEFKERLVSINRVTKVTKGGRTFTFAALVVVGNENGVVGYGLGKAKEATAAIQKGVDDAKKNLVKVPVLNGTLPHEQYGKYSGAYVYIQPATPGTGVIAGGAMRAVLESVGVKNVMAKSKGSSNPHSVVKATFDALTRMRDAYTVAQLRGVDLDTVFNG